MKTSGDNSKEIRAARLVTLHSACQLASVCKHNICRNYGSMLKSTLVYLYASMSNQYYTYIFTSECTSKPPISRWPHIHIPGAIVTGVSQVLIFVLCSFICFSPLVSLKNLSIYEGRRFHRIDITARVSGYAFSFVYLSHGNFAD
ncbi:hypothetical protein PUN28_014971 [Cardiocondyla obscurior]|uniref:Uncharacterized protein n=1 Tax=Cardiocondyla obscurior TaxID=286306 RepID=A0AAW2EY38_9HYME